jgi:hypothetical protein
MTNRPVLFEHIPKTGGVTLRGILQKVYGAEQMFVINSRNIKASLEEFSKLPSEQINRLSVVTGHGASMFEKYLTNPFRITILREPVSMFFSQYHFLKVSKGTVYFDEMQQVSSLEAYMEFAIENGQDNLLTRYLANSMHWLVDENLSIPEMNCTGENLLAVAIKNLHQFDAVVNLSTFDAGIYALSKKLGWPGIPLYKPSNRNTKKSKDIKISTELSDKLFHLLRFDIRLYDHFCRHSLDIAFRADHSKPGFKVFKAKQMLAKYAALLLGKN